MKLALLLATLAIVPLAGCQTLQDARTSKGRGTSRSYDSPFETVRKAVPKAANDLDLSIAGTYEDERYFLAQRGVTAFSWGERIAIFVTPESAARTSVEVVSKSYGTLNITATNFERPLLDKIGEKLREIARAKRGRSCSVENIISPHPGS